jgi:plastocyanin
MFSRTKALRTGIASLLSVFVMATCAPQTPKTVSPKLHKVEIRQMHFQPEELWVRRGDTVAFINTDLVAHNVTEIQNAWASSQLESGNVWKMVVDKHEDFFCTIHPMMKGRLRVINKLMQ